MRTYEDIEGYLLRLSQPFEELKKGLWVIHDEYDNIDNIVIHFAPPVIVFRVNLMKVPEKNREDFFRKLLELNATEMLHGAYGIEGEKVVAMATLQTENLDYNEFQAAVDSLSMAIADHYKILSQYH
jgi:hypothetical protein